MHFECHAALGWAIGNLARADRRLRNYCVLGAILPDIDAASYLLGTQSYLTYHHTFGHNVFLALGFVAAATWHCRSWKALLLSILCFCSHLLTDAWFTRMDLFLFWPFSGQGFLIPGGYGLVASVNTVLAYVSYASVVLLAFFIKRTPTDIFSPGLDRLIVDMFRPRTLDCAFCSRKGNQKCAECEKELCSKHASVGGGFQVRCPDCSDAALRNGA